MCGIAGIVGDRSGLDPAGLLAALKHRGPDQQGERAMGGEAWLAAARLAISDPTPAGNQPMATEDGAVVVVHNGEIYNARALREALEGRGQRFRSRCDTEVILRGYIEWGDEVVERLDGMFAFALWDTGRRRLLLGRDAIGIKPLWIARGRGRLVFASEVRALVAAGAVERRIAPGAVAAYLATGSVPEPGAILAGVEALPPGHRLALEGGRETVVRYWSAPKPGAGAAAGAAERVRARLGEAVERCLEADVPVALLLSGGIDSTALALLARVKPRTFHVRLGGETSLQAGLIARALGLAHEELPAEAGAEVALAALAAQDQPSIDGTNTFLVAGAVRAAGLKVALTGLGGDELFFGYPFHFNYLRARRVQRWLGPAAVPLRLLASSARGVAAASGSWRFEKAVALAAAGDPASTHGAARALFPPGSVARLLGRRGEAVARGGGEVLDHPGDELTRLEMRGYLVDTLLRDADVMGMAQSVELRVPMLDRPLVEEVLALDATVKLDGRRKKPLLLDAVPELPREVAEGAKEGFELPFDRWLVGALRGPVEEALRSPAAAARVGLSAKGVEAVWERFLARPDRAGAHRVWALFSLLAWAGAHRAAV